MEQRVITSEVQAATQRAKFARPGFQSRREGFAVISRDPSTSRRSAQDDDALSRFVFSG